MTGLVLLGAGLMSIMVPQECTQEERKFLEQFQYLTRQEGYQKPKEGEVTFYQTNGPVAGGSVSAIEIDDGIVYAGLFGDGVYGKKEEGDQWEPLRKGIRDPFVLSLARTKNGVLLAGTIKGGVYRSVDKGKNWTSSNTGLTNLEIATIMIYKDAVFIGTGSGLFKSVDQGLTWEPLNKGMESMLVKSFLIDPSGTYFAGTGGQGIFRSDDRGKKWEKIPFKLEGDTGLNENYIRVIAISSRKFLYAGTFGGGIFRSTDGGRKWIPVNSGMTNNSIRSIRVARDGSLLAGTGEGIFTSSDEGESWKSLNSDLPDKNIQSLSANSNAIYIGTASAIFRKQTGEVRWTLLDKGITYPAVSSLTGDPEKGFYAGTEGSGVFRSKDGGFSWFPMNEGLPDMNIRWIAEDSSHTLFLLTESGAFKGDRLKKSWVPLKEGLGDKGVHALYLDPENNLYSGTDYGLHRLDPSSGFWEKIPLPVESPVKWITGGNNRIYAASDQQLFLLKKGEVQPFPISLPQNIGAIRGILFRENLFVWSNGSIFEGNDSGSDIVWKPVSSPPFGASCQVFDVERIAGREIIFAGTERGAFWSPDRGTTWLRVSGNGASADTRSFFSPYPGTLLLGTGDRGVWVGLGL